MSRRTPIILAILVALLALAGTVSAYNPLEGDCAKSARLSAESYCEDGRWKIPKEYLFQEGDRLPVRQGRDFVKGARVGKVVEVKRVSAGQRVINTIVRSLLCGVARNVSGASGCRR